DANNYVSFEEDNYDEESSSKLSKKHQDEQCKTISRTIKRPSQRTRKKISVHLKEYHED
ncbi:3975_t:CDS:2, partial [Gigaspora rosea]